MSKPLGDAAHHVRLVEDRWTIVRQIVETVAIVAAGFWAFYTFVYQERIKPASEPAALETSINVHRLGRDARRDIVVISSVFRNAGKTEIDIAADGYAVFGIRYGAHATASEHVSADEAEIARDVPVQAITHVHSFMELRSAALHGPADRHIVMEPGSSEILTDTVVVPRGAYDTLKVYVIASPVKTPVTRKVDVRIERRKNGSLWLRGGDDFDEDDNVTEFALIP